MLQTFSGQSHHLHAQFIESCALISDDAAEAAAAALALTIPTSTSPSGHTERKKQPPPASAKSVKSNTNTNVAGRRSALSNSTKLKSPAATSKMSPASAV